MQSFPRTEKKKHNLKDYVRNLTQTMERSILGPLEIIDEVSGFVAFHYRDTSIN